MPPTNSPPTSAADRLRAAASFNIRSGPDYREWLKRDSRRQQFSLQFLGSARGEVPTQERFDFARLRIEKPHQRDPRH